MFFNPAGTVTGMTPLTEISKVQLIERMRTVAWSGKQTCFTAFIAAVKSTEQPLPVDVEELLMAAELSDSRVDKLIKVAAAHGLSDIITTSYAINGATGVLGDWLVVEYGEIFDKERATDGEIGFIDSCIAGLRFVDWGEEVTVEKIKLFGLIGDATRTRLLTSAPSFAYEKGPLLVVESFPTAVKPQDGHLVSEGVYTLVAMRELFPVYGRPDTLRPLFVLLSSLLESRHLHISPCAKGASRVRQLCSVLPKFQGYPDAEVIPVITRLASLPPMGVNLLTAYAWLYLQLLSCEAGTSVYDEADTLLQVCIATNDGEVKIEDTERIGHYLLTRRS